MARLLMVDDDPDQLKMWKLALEIAGHEVESALTLEQAIAALAGAPDVLVMDLRLPSLEDGLALIRQTRSRQPTGIVVLSGWPQDLDGRPEAGMVDRVLVKPARPPALLRAIAELVTLAAVPVGNPQTACP